MLMPEFVQTYCSDLVSLYGSADSTDKFNLPCDDTIEDDSGEKVQVVYCGKQAIPVLDIVTLDEDDFAQIYPSFEARELYKSYLDTIKILDGEEALNHIRNEMRREQERVKTFSQETEIADNFW